MEAGIIAENINFCRCSMTSIIHRAICFILPVILFSCNGNTVERLFDQSPEQRAEAAVNEVKDMLVGSTYGWLAYFQYNNMGSDVYFNIHFKDNNHALIEYMDNGEVESHETTYTLRYTQQVDLVFDSHSIFATLAEQGKGGDFRFEWSRREDQKFYFNTRNDASEGTGILELRPAKSADAYARLAMIHKLMVDDSQKSFFRVLTIESSGMKCNMNVTSTKTAFLEWLEDGAVKREKHAIRYIEDGFEFVSPVEMGGAVIKRFVLGTDGAFEAWDADSKVGFLNYGNKPFVYPNAANLFKTQSTVYMTSKYSYKMQQAVNRLLVIDPTFTAVQIYLTNGITIFRNNGNPRWYTYVMKIYYGMDWVQFQLMGGGAADVAYYNNGGKEMVQLFNATFNIVIRDGSIYLVQQADPAIWMTVAYI